MQPHHFHQVPPYSGNRARWPAGLTHLPQAEPLPQSELATAVQELRQATADEWAEPLPCSGLQALNRARRVHFAQRDFLRQFSKQVAA